MAVAEKEIDDLKTAMGLTHEVLTIAGEQISVREFTPSDLIEVLPLIGSVKFSATELVELVNPATGEPEQFIQQNVSKLLLGGSPIVFRVLEMCTGKDQQWLKSLGMGNLMKLAKAVLRVNESFFEEAGDLIESLYGLMGRLQKVKGTLNNEPPVGSRSPQYLDEQASP